MIRVSDEAAAAGCQRSDEEGGRGDGADIACSLQQSRISLYSLPSPCSAMRDDEFHRNEELVMGSSGRTNNNVVKYILSSHNLRYCTIIIIFVIIITIVTIPVGRNRILLCDEFSELVPAAPGQWKRDRSCKFSRERIFGVAPADARET